MAALGADCGAEGSGGVKIPDDVFTTRCRYCGHGQTGAENKEIPDDKLFIHFWAKQSPCRIIGIAQCDKVQGECLDFKPNPMFGICEYCTFTNSFHPGFCTAPSGPVNKRRVFLGWSGIGDYYSVHALFTCDRYRVNELWKDLILKNAVEGHAPANFDPDTWEALEHIDGTPTAKQWADLQAKRKAELEAEVEKEAGKRAELEQKQISMFEDY